MAPQIAATGTPASRNRRAISAKGCPPPVSHMSAPDRISRSLAAGSRSESRMSGTMRTPPIVVIGSVDSATVTMSKLVLV